MIRDDNHLAAYGLHGIHEASYAGIHSLNSLYSRGHDSCMTDHIAVGVVQDDEVILLGLDGFHHLVRDLYGAHFRLEIVGGNLRGRYQDAVLAFVFLFHAAVEEERDMGIFLGFGYAELLQPLFRDDLPKGILDALGRIGDVDVHTLFILGHGGEGELQSLYPVEAVKGFICEGMGELSCAVGAEIEEDDAVTCPCSRL